MDHIDFASYDLNSPAGRLALLRQIPPDRGVVRQYYDGILDLLAREVEYRRNLEDGNFEPDDQEAEHFEQLYWCALLLYLVGNVNDVVVMWQAKNLNMDTSCGFDPQFLVGAGVDATLAFLETNKQTEIADYVREVREAGEFDYLAKWERYRIHYFYSDHRQPFTE